MSGVLVYQNTYVHIPGIAGFRVERANSHSNDLTSHSIPCNYGWSCFSVLEAGSFLFMLIAVVLLVGLTIAAFLESTVCKQVLGTSCTMQKRLGAFQQHLRQLVQSDDNTIGCRLSLQDHVPICRLGIVCLAAVCRLIHCLHAVFRQLMPCIQNAHKPHSSCMSCPPGFHNMLIFENLIR